MTVCDLVDLGGRAKAAASIVASAPSGTRDRGLERAAEELERARDEILSANQGDIASAREAGVAETTVDRLALNPGRVAGMAAGLRALAASPDLLGEVLDGWVRPNGLQIRRVRVPLGVVGVIYENRPNVTADAAGLCLRAGNVAFLRGSSAALRTNVVIAAAMRAAYREVGLPEDALILVEDPSRETVRDFLALDGVIDCLIPRGGPSLIAEVKQHCRVPYVIDGDGNCHVYVDESADLEMACAIIVNAKTQRPSVCNAAETLLVHRRVAAEFLKLVGPLLGGVELRGDEETRSILGDSKVARATVEDYAREFLDLTLAVKVVSDIDEAIAHIGRFGSGHTEAIVTSDLASARRFQSEVDAAAVVVNASTRFTDGEQFGFGAEIGISTQKLHARGPMGAASLTTYKYLVEGSGQVRP
ncbi:MAG: glutamate-5-semialdehyde dehydrogenase [Acidimicrobiales bacterium]